VSLKTLPKGFRHRLYNPMMDCGDLLPSQEITRAAGDPNCPAGVLTQAVVIVSSDGGLSWKLKHVTTGTGSVIPVRPIWAATDAAGSVYFTWYDNHNVYLNVSSNGGDTWLSSVRVNQPPSITSIIPTASAGGAGIVEIAWYGTDRAGDPFDASVMGNPADSNGAEWRVYRARSTDYGKTFSQTVATDVVHRGEECTRDDLGNCDFASGEADLFDDFGLAISPSTGRASIAYTSDQPEGTHDRIFAGYATEKQ
jgi:hypothetical protein